MKWGECGPASPVLLNRLQKSYMKMPKSIEYMSTTIEKIDVVNWLMKLHHLKLVFGMSVRKHLLEVLSTYKIKEFLNTIAPFLSICKKGWFSY